MQIMGVYRNCLCELSIRDWRRSRFDTGASAVAFLGFISYAGWWYQRRLRFQFKLLINQIDKGAEDDVVPLPAPTTYDHTAVVGGET